MTAATPLAIQHKIIGIGFDNSAASGANIVIILEKILQIMNADGANKDGNTSVIT